MVSRSTFPHRSLSVQFDECLYCGADWYGSVGTSVFFPILYTFLLTNLLVIPLVSFIMYTTVIMLLFTPYFPLQSIIAIGVKWLIGLLNSCVRWVEQLPGHPLMAYGFMVQMYWVFIFFSFIRILFEYMQSEEFDS